MAASPSPSPPVPPSPTAAATLFANIQGRLLVGLVDNLRLGPLVAETAPWAPGLGVLDQRGERVLWTAQWRDRREEDFLATSASTSAAASMSSTTTTATSTSSTTTTAISTTVRTGRVLLLEPELALEGVFHQQLLATMHGIEVGS